MDILPQDPVILLSYVNTKLRNDYTSLEEFIEKEDVVVAQLLATLKRIGYEYSEEKNQFI